MKSPRTYLICDFLLKFAGIATALSLAIATIGIPLPVPLAKDASSPFPCMHCGCGCATADMCWRQCCCFTNAEKLAWAAEHGVKVPEFVLDGVAEETDADREELANVKPCCRQRILAARAASCCDRKSSANCCESPAEAPTLPEPGVLAIHALKCQGNSLGLSLVPPSVPADEIAAELLLVPGEAVSIVDTTIYRPPFAEVVAPPPEFTIL